MEQLLEIITHLIQKKREGQYWDFKEFPHKNKAALVHDILCMANAEHKGNRYLVFGITDPSQGTDVVGLSSKTPNRKNQQQYINQMTDP